jgi:D-amino-acid oxidase
MFVKQGVLEHTCDATDMHHIVNKADLIINCTGLLATKVGGVMDRDVIAARG